MYLYGIVASIRMHTWTLTLTRTHTTHTHARENVLQYIVYDLVVEIDFGRKLLLMASSTLASLTWWENWSCHDTYLGDRLFSKQRKHQTTYSQCDSTMSSHFWDPPVTTNNFKYCELSPGSTISRYEMGSVCSRPIDFFSVFNAT